MEKTDSQTPPSHLLNNYEDDLEGDSSCAYKPGVLRCRLEPHTKTPTYSDPQWFQNFQDKELLHTQGQIYSRDIH